MNRKSSAIWKGGFPKGSGAITSGSGVLKETQYSFASRFESGIGTNPEELIAAAHAGCFSMAFAAELSKAGITPDSIETTATITMENIEANWTITESHLDVKATIPGVDTARALEIADAAKAGCPISRLLNAKVTMNAKIDG